MPFRAGIFITWLTCALFIWLCGCSSLQTPEGVSMNAKGQSVAQIATGCKTTIEKFPDGHTLTTHEGTKCAIAQTDGGQGSKDLYQFMGVVFNAILGVGSIVIQSLR